MIPLVVCQYANDMRYQYNTSSRENARREVFLIQVNRVITNGEE